MKTEKLDSDVLKLIAARHDVDVECITIGDKGAVFCRRGEELLCLCQQGSHFWNELEAEVLVDRLFERIRNM